MHVVGGKVLLSAFYLQYLLLPSLKFKTIHAIVQIGEDHVQVSIPTQWDFEGHQHFILDTSLSKRYVIIINDIALYIFYSEGGEGHFKNLMSPQKLASVGGSIQSVDLTNDVNNFSKMDTLFDIDLSEGDLVFYKPSSIVTFILASSCALVLKHHLQNSL